MKNVKKLIKIGSKGDTIIEILLSITVLSLVLSVSYSLANRSAQSTRQAQERGEAQRLAEEQLELLRGYITVDQEWETNQCFREDNPSTPGNESDEPTSNIVDCENRGSGDRYNLRVDKPFDDTYTAYVTWPNVKGGTDELTLSYKLPATGDIPSTPLYQCGNDIDDGPTYDGVKDEDDPDCWAVPGHRASYDPTRDVEDPPKACADGIDNDSPPDGVFDHSSVNPVNPDPGCDNPEDNNEFNHIPPFIWDELEGANYSFCAPDRTLYNPFGDGHDGCLRSGNAMYAYRNFNAVYSGIPNGLKAGSATLRICYQNHGTDRPDGYTDYKLKATVGHGTTRVISLPWRTSAGCANTSVTVEEVNSSDVRLIWFNDAWVGGDANLRINSIHIRQEASEGTTPANQAIDGEDYISCELGGSSGYCIRSDALYANSVYSLSSASTNPPFVTKYRFNSSITPGNYDLSLTYFNGDYDTLPAPPGYSYSITVEYPGGPRTFSLPIENNLQSRHIRQAYLNNINITGGSPTITVRWNNDYYNPGVFDANFGINSIMLTKR